MVAIDINFDFRTDATGKNPTPDAPDVFASFQCLVLRSHRTTGFPSSNITEEFPLVGGMRPGMCDRFRTGDG